MYLKGKDYHSHLHMYQLDLNEFSNLLTNVMGSKWLACDLSLGVSEAKVCVLSMELPRHGGLKYVVIIPHTCLWKALSIYWLPV